jgi:hypothetical protein
MGIEIEVKTGDHGLDFDENGSRKLVQEALTYANAEEGNFLLCLMGKTKGSSHRKGFKLSRQEKNIFHGTVQTGDNGSCFNCKLVIPDELNAAHLYGDLWKFCNQKKHSESAPIVPSAETSATEKVTIKKAKIFDGPDFINDEINRGLFILYVQEELASKEEKNFSCGEIRDLMFRRDFIGEEVLNWSISRFCVMAANKGILSRVENKMVKGLRYTLAEELLKPAKIETPDSLEPEKAPEALDASDRPIIKLDDVLETLTRNKEELSIRITALKNETIKLEAELQKVSAEKIKIKEEMYKIIDAK